MSARGRIVGLTALAATVAAAGAVAVGALQGERPEATATPTAPSLPEGPPPLGLDLGVRDDQEARDLRRAAVRYASGDLRAAGVLFARHDSLEARVGQAFSAWPNETLDRLEQLAGLHPDDPAVLLHLGIVRLWTGRGDAEDALRQTVQVAPDTASRVTADNLLHPGFAPGIPAFVPTAAPPSGLDRLRPSDQLARLARDAQTSVDGKLRYGAALQRLGRQLSAEKVYASATRAEPDNVEALVAAAVGRFSKARPADAFSRLGPLTRRFPKSATVRFHLGLLLLWSGEVRAATRQLTRATEVEPGSPLALRAADYLAELRKRTP